MNVITLTSTGGLVAVVLALGPTLVLVVLVVLVGAAAAAVTQWQQ